MTPGDGVSGPFQTFCTDNVPGGRRQRSIPPVDPVITIYVGAVSVYVKDSNPGVKNCIIRVTVNELHVSLKPVKNAISLFVIYEKSLGEENPLK